MPARYRNDAYDPAETAAPGRSGRRPPVCEICARPLTRWTAVLGRSRCTCCAPPRPPTADREPVSLGEALAGAFEEVARAARVTPLVPAQRTTATGVPVTAVPTTGAPATAVPAAGAGSASAPRPPALRADDDGGSWRPGGAAPGLAVPSDVA